jgi:putative tryptophan/tyrosine transport system substrate-binding protein
MAQTLKTIGLWLSILLLAGALHADSTAPPPRQRVVYLGRIGAAADPGFLALSQAVARLPAGLAQRIELRFVTALLADGQHRIQLAIDEALALRPEVLVGTAFVASELKKRHVQQPVLFTSFVHPVRMGLVSTTGARQEAMAGVWIADETDGKRLELLHDAYPGVRSVAMLMDRDWGMATDATRILPPLARKLGLTLTLLYADDLKEAEPLLARPESARFDAWLLPPTGLSYLYSPQLLKIFSTWGKPVITGDTQDVMRGAPLALMVEDAFRWDAQAEVLARVLQGERAGAIPIQRSYKALLSARPEPIGGFPAPSATVLRRADLIVR